MRSVMSLTAVAPSSFDDAGSTRPATNPYIARVPWPIWNTARGGEVGIAPGGVVKGETILFRNGASIVEIRHVVAG